MTSMKIILPTLDYLPGDEVNGILEIECEKPFNSRKTLIRFVGELYAQASTPENTNVHLILMDHSIVLSEATRYPEGKHRINFSFRLPDSGYNLIHNYSKPIDTLYPSYQGANAQITYVIHAKLDLSMRKSITTNVPIIISIPDEGLLNEPVREDVIGYGELILYLEADTQLYCTGSPYVLRYRLNTVNKINTIKCEITHSEVTQIAGNYTAYTKVLSKGIVNPEMNQYEWQTIILPSYRTTVKTFSIPEFRSSVSLGISVELPRRQRIITTIPLVSLKCPEKLKPVIGKKIGTENNCPHCGAEMTLGGMVRPDGFVICPKCFKKFKPEKL